MYLDRCRADRQKPSTIDMKESLARTFLLPTLGGKDLRACCSDIEVQRLEVAVRDVGPRRSDGDLGLGLEIHAEARAQVTSAAFERSRSVGVLVKGSGTILVASDMVVRDTQAQESAGAFGAGLSVQGGAHAEITRVAFERNRLFAIGGHSHRARLEG